MTTANHRTKPQQTGAGTKRSLSLLFLAVCVLLGAVLLAGSAGATGVVSVNTTGIVAQTSETVLIPVTVTGANGIDSWQLDVETRSDAVATIIPNKSSVKKAGATSTGSTVYWYTTSNNPADYITGEKTLFYIAVTPQTTGEIPVNISDVRIYENGAQTRSSYQVVCGNLSVTGTGTGTSTSTGLTSGSTDSGATVHVGKTNSAGSYSSGETTGVRQIVIPNVPDETVIDYVESTGPYDVPAGVTYVAADLVTLFGTWKTGDMYSVSMGIESSALEDAGITAEDVIIIHPIETYDKSGALTGVTWYKVPIQSITTLPSGIVEYTFNTWSCGSFLVVTDAGGNTFATETATTAIGETSGFSLDPMMIGIIGGIVAVIIIVIVVGVVISRRKHR